MSADKIICPICLEEINDTKTFITLPCQHKMHFTCGTEALTNSSLCPMCRKETNTVEHHDKDDDAIVNRFELTYNDSSDSDLDSSDIDLSSESSIDIDDLYDVPYPQLFDSVYHSLTRVNTEIDTSGLDTTQQVGGISVADIHRMIDEITERMITQL